MMRVALSKFYHLVIVPAFCCFFFSKSKALFVFQFLALLHDAGTATLMDCYGLIQNDKSSLAAQCVEVVSYGLISSSVK